MQRNILRAAVLAVIVLSLAACGGDEATPTSSVETPVAATVQAPAPEATGSAAEAGGAADPAGLAPAGKRPPAPTMPQLTDGWTRIEPGGDTRCAHDTPFSFWVRPGTSNHVLFYLQGGGACWDADSCAPGSRRYDSSVDEADNPSDDAGIFDLANLSNPFSSYYMVFVPTCAGDLFWGNNIATYQDAAGKPLTIHHKGFVNGMAALNWVFEQFSSPESVFVVGTSAGAVGSILFAPYVLDHYPGAQVGQLGDSEAFVFDQPIAFSNGWNSAANFPSWIPDQEAVGADWSMARIYTAVANQYPEATFAQYTSAHDETQAAYYKALSTGTMRWEDALSASLSQIVAGATNFRLYVAPGAEHGILNTPQFYTLQVKGLSLRDWVAALTLGKAVDNVQCSNC